MKIRENKIKRTFVNKSNRTGIKIIKKIGRHFTLLKPNTYLPIQLNSTQLNWENSKHVLEISFIHVCKTQLNPTQLNTTQHNTTQLNSTDLRAPSPILSIRDPVEQNMQMSDICGQ
jgi:hypothetical protein